MCSSTKIKAERGVLIHAYITDALLNVLILTCLEHSAVYDCFLCRKVNMTALSLELGGGGGGGGGDSIKPHCGCSL